MSAVTPYIYIIIINNNNNIIIIVVIIKGSLGGETSVLRTFRMSGKELVTEGVSERKSSSGKELVKERVSQRNG